MKTPNIVEFYSSTPIGRNGRHLTHGKTEHRWRVRRAGRIVADSGEGYSSKSAARRSFGRMVDAFASGNFKEAK